MTVSSGGTTAYYVSPCHRSDPIGCCLDEKWWDKSGGPLADGSRRVNDSVSFLVSFQKVRRIPIAEFFFFEISLELIGSAFKVSFLVFGSTGNFW